MNLRQYQIEMVEAIWKEITVESTALAQLPTGAGKTFTIAELMRRSIEIKSDIKIAMIMGRVDLVNQTERALASRLGWRDIGVYCGSLGRKELSRRVTVASIQSISDVVIRGLNLLIIDEAQNLDQNKGNYIRFIEKAQLESPKLKIVAVTATPFRMNGVIYGDGKLFKRLCFSRKIQDMIALGFLCRPVLKQGENAFDTSGLRVRAGEYVQEDVDALVSNEETLSLQVKEALQKMQGRQCVAWATANIDHCNRVISALEREGERATSVHSKQNRETRSANLGAFMGGSCRHMVFVSVLSEGFDHPPIDTVVLMRPTRSPVLYVQTVGRGLRISPEKQDCLVLDYGQVVRELGPLDAPKVKGAKVDGDAVLKLCPACASYVPGGCRACPDCGHGFPPPAPPEENLTPRHDSTAKILSDAGKPETETLGPAVIAMHESKSGNLCVRITYQDRNMMTRWGGYQGTSEYFVTTSPWAMERLERRLGDIGASLPGIPFEGEIEVTGSFEVVKTKDGKYDRVIAVKRVSDAPPVNKREAGFGESAEEDASFEFGYNAKPNSPRDIGF